MGIGIATEVENNFPTIQDMKIQDMEDGKIYISDKLDVNSSIMSGVFLQKKGTIYRAEPFLLNAKNEVGFLTAQDLRVECEFDFKANNIYDIVKELPLKCLSDILLHDFYNQFYDSEYYENMMKRYKSNKFQRTFYGNSGKYISELQVGDTLLCASGFNRLSFCYEVQRTLQGFNMKLNRLSDMVELLNPTGEYTIEKLKSDALKCYEKGVLLGTLTKVLCDYEHMRISDLLLIYSISGQNQEMILEKSKFK